MYIKRVQCVYEKPKQTDARARARDAPNLKDGYGLHPVQEEREREGEAESERENG